MSRYRAQFWNYIFVLLFSVNSYSESDCVILCLFCTPSHEQLLNDWLLPSLQDDFEIVAKHAPQECSGNFWSENWEKTTKKKVIHIIDTIENNMGKIMIFSDADVQFFSSVTDIITPFFDAGYDLIIQEDFPNQWVCSGFFAQTCNEKTLSLWKKVHDYMCEHNEKSDQKSLNYVLDHLLLGDIRWTYLPLTFMNGGRLTGGSVWEPGDTVSIPRDIVIHHANFTVGIENKIEQLRLVKKVIEKRRKN